MDQGTVMWFNRDKGVGFIHPDSAPGNMSIPAYAADIEVDGDPKLEDNQRVEFIIALSKDGIPCAQHVRII
jgi:CspA family cold shock protein